MMDGIRGWIEAEGAGHWFFVAFPAVLLTLFIWFKGRRVRFLIPSLILTIIIINPWFYIAWDELELYAYWRILWIIPVIPVVASLVPSLTEKIKKPWIKMTVAAAGIGVVIIGGTFLYSGAGGSFVEAVNASKLPQNVVQIADRLLEFDEHPRIITQDPISVYIRQYTGEMNQLFGRDLYGYINIPSDEAIMAHKILSNPEADNKEVAQLMLDNGFDYLVYQCDPGQQFDLIEDVADYGIYRAIGNPSVFKKRNELGQVLSKTFIDKNGIPVNGEDGYAIISYQYDNNGNIIREFHSDVNGKGVENEHGVAGYEREYNSRSMLVMARNLDQNGQIIKNGLGYSEVRFEYRGNCVNKESYYDEKGTPTNRIDKQYASKKNEWSSGRNREIIGESYFDTKGEPICSTAGYASWKLETVDSIQYIHFYDENGKEMPLEHINLIKGIKYNRDGWSDWITPETNTENWCINIASANLGNKHAGDSYSCSIEIEFNDVSATDKSWFGFRTQGTVDKQWEIDNVWNTGIVKMNEPPMDGVYCFSHTNMVTDAMEKASTFYIGFRCDNWAGGSFRVRNVKIEKGDAPSEWSPGLD